MHQSRARTGDGVRHRGAQSNQQPSAIDRTRVDRQIRQLVLWVVPTEERLRWLRRVARWDRQPGLERCSWGLVLDDLRAKGLRARTQPVGWNGEAVSLEAVIADPGLRRCPTPVGSPGWIRLLGSGGAEDTDEALV